MKVAYLILTHADPEHLWRLIGALGDRADVYVHVDAKSDLAQFQTRTSPNVMFLADRVDVRWAGFSMVRAILALIETAMAKGESYSHLVLLSGADYPIKPAHEIEAFLFANKDHEFIKYIDVRESPDHYMKQIEVKHFRDPILAGGGFPDRVARKVANSLKMSNKWDGKWIPYFGSNWWALTPACCEKVLETAKKVPFIEMNRRTFAPDEKFFHTIVGNSEFAAKSDGLQEFLGVGTCNLANLHIVDPSLAKWFTEEDFEQVASSDKFFVRKVRTGTSTDLLDRIDKELLGS